MTQISINTTQNVPISFTAATLLERILASLTDILIKFAYVILIYGIFFYWLEFERWMESMDGWSVMAISGVFLLPILFYSLILEALFEGQTIGKRLLKIKVVKIDGYQATFGDYLIRWIFRLIDFSIMNGLIALICVAATDKNQRLGDIAAGTGVISLKNSVTISSTILEEIGDEYVPQFPQVIKLSDNDIRIIKENFLAARARTDFKSLANLRSKIESVTGIKSTVADAVFIDIVLKDYNYYTQSM